MSGLSHGRVRAAFGGDPRTPFSVGRLVAVDDDGGVLLHLTDGTDLAVVVADTERLDATLGRADLCLLRGQPLVIVNSTRLVLGVATGPPVAPERLRVNWVTRLEDGMAVELAGSDDQPSFDLFELAEAS